jgi:6-phospho-beta-glucosidase
VEAVEVKLALIGGGGVRAPLFVQSALRRADSLGLDEICLMDVSGAALETFGAIAAELAQQSGARARITTTTDPELALSGADFVITTIRPGGLEGRIADERIALELGVLGQETTGAGGFAMALRSIPVILKYAQLMQRLCPNAWLLNFTNPAGLVTQALHDAGFVRSVGICDSANGAQRALAKWYNVPEAEISADLFGLNHLSFTTRATLAGRDVLPQALASDAFLDGSAERVFEHDLVRRHGMWINEYLYYYYYAEKAVAALQAGPTRGEEILALNKELDLRLSAIDLHSDTAGALSIYFDYEHQRSASYMASARQPTATDTPAAAEPDDGEGYAGVALGIIAALAGGAPLRSGLNVRNDGAIDGLADSDVVEVACTIDSNGIVPISFGAMPEPQGNLVRTVKIYERMAVRAIAARDRELAIDALTVHPLILSYSRARPLVDRYLEAHAAFAGQWGAR